MIKSTVRIFKRQKSSMLKDVFCAFVNYYILALLIWTHLMSQIRLFEIFANFVRQTGIKVCSDDCGTSCNLFLLWCFVCSNDWCLSSSSHIVLRFVKRNDIVSSIRKLSRNATWVVMGKYTAFVEVRRNSECLWMSSTKIRVPSLVQVICERNLFYFVFSQ